MRRLTPVKVFCYCSRGHKGRRRIGEAAPARKDSRETRRTCQTGRNRKKAAPQRTAAAKPKRRPMAVKAPAAAPAAPPAAEAPAAPRKPGFYEAVAIYERGVQALQRHDYQGAAGFFRTVLERYPDERELLERARLYLRVVRARDHPSAAGPQKPAEQVYAATVALNSGRSLRRAGASPERAGS